MWFAFPSSQQGSQHPGLTITRAAAMETRRRGVRRSQVSERLGDRVVSELEDGKKKGRKRKASKTCFLDRYHLFFFF